MSRQAKVMAKATPQPLPFLMIGAMLGLLSGWLALAM
ncbi:hypothetical protein C8N34_109210 [Gemmobacter caeni]|uniref:Uncharacterized protein n=1 Tax=Gemmobacter caeni TaxID=589035 RepID=A0A2T6AY17_9RHOB|nr:hypothetical protein C8N34_109210 [Gemmobacter caeni]